MCVWSVSARRRLVLYNVTQRPLVVSRAVEEFIDATRIEHLLLLEAILLLYNREPGVCYMRTKSRQRLTAII